MLGALLGHFWFLKVWGAFLKNTIKIGFFCSWLPCLSHMSELIQTTFNLPALLGLADASKKRRVMKRPSSSQELVGTQADGEDIDGEIRDREEGEDEEDDNDDEGEEEDQHCIGDEEEPLVHEGDAKKGVKKRPAGRGAREGSNRTCLELLKFHTLILLENN